MTLVARAEKFGVQLNTKNNAFYMLKNNRGKQVINNTTIRIILIFAGNKNRHTLNNSQHFK